MNRFIKLLLAISVLVEVGLLIWGVFYRRDLNRDYQLFLDKSTNSGLLFTADLQPPSFLLPPAVSEINNMAVYGAVATGRVYEQPLRSRQSGNILGKATAVEVVTTGPGLGKTERISLVVQFALSSDPARNAMPWVLQTASGFSEVPVAVGDSLLSKDEIARIFSRGTVWNFVPALDLNLPELRELVEYKTYVQSYYDGSIYIKPSLFLSLISRSWLPVVLDIVPLSEITE